MEARGRGRIRRACHAALAVAALWGLAGCAGSDGDEAGPSGSAPSTTRAPAPTVEVWTGDDDAFYVPPDPLPEGAPGDLLRVQEVSRTDDEVTWRVMYVSTDSRGEPRPVTGIVTHPTAEPPEEGWPVIVTAPGTVGLAPQCGLSRRGEAPPAFGVEGVRVLTDYIGMAAPGDRQAYLSRGSEGHSVLDGARAARNLEGSGAGSRLLLFGHSQGGHGAQSGHELADEYAPELELLGTVSGAPAAVFDRTFGGIDDIVARIVSTMGLYGAATDHPEVDPGDYLRPEVVEVVEDVVDDTCLDGIISALAPHAASPDYWRADPMSTEPAERILRANDVGFEAADAPLLLISGTEDDRVVHERVLALYERLCGSGQVTELIVLEGAHHGNEIELARDRIEQWFADRLAGEPPTDTCAG